MAACVPDASRAFSFAPGLSRRHAGRLCGPAGGRPDYQAPEVALPSAWHAGDPATSSAQDLAVWWRQLEDPVLDRLIEEALAGNHDLKVAQASLRQARASRNQAQGGYFPTISASAGGSSNQTAKVINPTYVGTTYTAGFDASLGNRFVRRRAAQCRGCQRRPGSQSGQPRQIHAFHWWPRLR